MTPEEHSVTGTLRGSAAGPGDGAPADPGTSPRRMRKKDFLARLLDRARLRSALARILPREGVLVLNYHRIGDGSRSCYDRALWSATQDAFDAQLAFLKAQCDVIELDDLPHALASRGGRHVAITFDDGYVDNYELAFPVLRRHDLPAAFFIATGFVDRPTLPWWDEIAMLVRKTDAPQLDMRDWVTRPIEMEASREATISLLLRTYKTLAPDQAHAFLARLRTVAGHQDGAGSNRRWMTWDMIREMAAGGMTIGGHTINHPVLARLSTAQQREEITGCAARLDEELGQRMHYFAYPVGGRNCFNADTMRCLDALGVRNAFSYYGGLATRRSHRLDIPRTAIEPHIEQDLFRSIAQLPQVFCRFPE